MSVPAGFFAAVRPHMLVGCPITSGPVKWVSRYNVETGRSRYSKDLIRAHPQLILQGDERRRRQADFDKACRALIEKAQQENGLAVDEAWLKLKLFGPDFHVRRSLPLNNRPTIAPTAGETSMRQVKGLRA